MAGNYNENVTLVCNLNSGDKVLITGEEIFGTYDQSYSWRWISGIATSSSWDADESISGRFNISYHSTVELQNWWHRDIKNPRNFFYMKGRFVVEIPYRDSQSMDYAYKYGRKEFAKMIMAQKLKNAKLTDTTISTEVNFFT